MTQTRAILSRWILPFALAAAYLCAGLALAQLAQAQSIRKDHFNHLTTGFPLTGAHEQAKCESCHVQGIFKGTPKDCRQCHGPSARVSTVTMPQNHIPVGERCDVCHSTTKFYDVRYNHASATPGNCGQCHNGTTPAPTKPARHIVTNASCDACHRVMAWLPATFDHSTVAPGSCAQCHNGTAATGKSATHLITSASCDACHATSAWSPATRFDHVGVTPGTCTQCHDGAHATGKGAGHVPTAATCDACHATSGWTPARVDHSTVVPGTCATCHDGKLATGKTANHIPTTQSCDSCHRTTAWTPTSFTHRGIAPGSCAQCHNGTIAGGKPANHLVTSSSCDSCHATTGWLPATFNHAGIVPGTCANCHNGSTATGLAAAHIPVPGKSCDACHSGTNFTTFSGASMNHGAVHGVACITCHEAGTSFFGGTVMTRPTAVNDPAHPQTGDCAACHNTASFGAVTGKPANHIPTSQPCALCHLTPGDYTSATMSHQGITGGCASCHAAGLSFANVTPKAPPANHLPVAGIACQGCHSVTNFTTFAGTAINHAAVAGISCQTCHETGKSWFGVAIVTRPTPATDPAHPATGDCATCHNTASFAGAAQKPANHIPTTQACMLCHASPPNYTVFAMNHQGIVGGCATCHGPGLTFATSFSPKSPPATHIPVAGVACESCHSATGYTTFAGTAMNHAGTGAIACQTCHETGKSWFGVAIVTRPTPAADPAHPATGDCGACHTTASFNVVTAKPANHIPTTQACALCHASPPNYAVFAMNHQGITSNCAQCHGPGLSFANIVPKAPPANHIPTNGAACESCHSASNFTTFSGTAMNHNAVSSLTCATCHETGKRFFGVTIVTRPTTAQDANHPPTGNCSACHTTSTFATTAKPANHIPTTQACALCHTSTDYSTATMNHQGISSNCALCHGAGLSFANIVPKEPPATHIPYTGVACEACHSASAFTTFSGTRMNHTAVASLRCTACHESGMSWFGVRIVTRPSPNHHAGQECNNSGCHNTSTFSKVLLLGKPPAARYFELPKPPAGPAQNPSRPLGRGMQHR